jgi:hypothetical protein
MFPMKVAVRVAGATGAAASASTAIQIAVGIDGRQDTTKGRGPTVNSCKRAASPAH